MPYINKNDRQIWAEAGLDTFLETLGKYELTPGDLNYIITRIVATYIASVDRINYEAYNTVIGVLECAKLEAYRRLVAPHEMGKLEVNGDVYGL